MSSAIETQLSQLAMGKPDWRPVKFGEVAFEPKESVKDALKEGIEHVVGLEHIETEDIHLRRSNSIEESTTFSKKFSPGDVLFGRRRAYLKKAAQADFAGICSGDIIVMRANDGQLLPELLPFIVNNEKFFDWAITHSAGGLSPRCKFKDLANYEFLLPPKAQQAEIAELLWAMDEVIRNVDSVLCCLPNAVAAIFREAISGNPEDIALSDIGDIVTGSTPATKNLDYWENGTIPFVTPAEFTEVPYIEGSARTITPAGLDVARALPKGSVLVVSIGATIGKVAITKQDCATNQQINAVVLRHDYCAVYVMLALIFFNQRILARAGATTLPIINKGEFSKVRIPNISQSKAAALESKYFELENARQVNMDLLNKSKSLQKSLINQVF